MNNLVYQVNRETLVGENDDNNNNHHPNIENLSGKRPPVPTPVNVIPPPIPVRHPTNENQTTMPNNSEKPRKPSEQPPELPPKTTRVLAAVGKGPTAAQINAPVPKTNPTNKENQTVTTTEVETVSPSNEGKLVQRHKSKSARRKMTEEEAIKELGSFHRSHSRSDSFSSVFFDLEPVAGKDDPIGRFKIKKKLGSGYGVKSID